MGNLVQIPKPSSQFPRARDGVAFPEWVGIYVDDGEIAKAQLVDGLTMRAEQQWATYDLTDSIPIPAGQTVRGHFTMNAGPGRDGRSHSFSSTIPYLCRLEFAVGRGEIITGDVVIVDGVVLGDALPVRVPEAERLDEASEALYQALAAVSDAESERIIDGRGAYDGNPAKQLRIVRSRVLDALKAVRGLDGYDWSPDGPRYQPDEEPF